jgi:SNF2 family DNA or RNA helicase
MGKTMQALLAMRYLVPDGRILVVATGDAIGVWKDEVRLWLGEEASVYAGPKADASALDAPGIVITNYHRIAYLLQTNRSWDGAIFDESQMLRNRKTVTLYKTVRSYFDKAAFGLRDIPVFFLSGTPVVKAAGDLWPILHLIDPKRWSSYWKFVQKYAITWQDTFGWHTEGVANVKQLWEELADVCLRRVEGTIPKTRQRIPLAMSTRQAKAYRELEKEMVTAVDFVLDNSGSGYLLVPSILALETRLRQLLACPRILGVDDDGAAVASLADLASRTNYPFVVFSPFREALPHAAWALERAGRHTWTIHGGMAEGGFAKGVADFTRAARDGLAPALLCTVQMGKSWSVAEVTNYCYFLGADWNNTTQVQAESRLAREGQTEEMVYAGYFVHENTIDEHVLEVLAGKRRLADVIMDRKTARNRR